ncbi:MAG: DASS family sodium-coupled anion symporter [Acidobacteria bacterium]|nr:DASS family sodium-coupled anion symporter [Acidobacteriota bacterium]
MADEPSERSLRQRIGLVLGIVLFLLALAAPTPEGMKPEAQRMAAVALLMATWWISEAISIALTSLLPLALFPALGILPSEKVAPYYSDHNIYLFFGGFVVALAIQKWNLHKRIALHTIHWVGSKPSRLLLGFMLATAFLSMWMSNTACAMMMFPIGMAVVLQLAGETAAGPDTGKQVTENFGTVLMLGIAYSASLGGIATLIGTPTNVVFAGMVRRLFPEAPEIGFLRWMLVGLPLVVLFLPLMWFYLCRFGTRVSVHTLRFSSSETVIEEELRKLGKMTRPEKYVLAVWTTMALLWIFRSPIRLGTFTVPGWSQLFGQPAYLHDATVAMAMALLLCLMRVKTGNQQDGGVASRQFLVDWETVRYGVPWGILLLFGGGFAMAAGFEQTGLSSWVGSLLSGMAGFPPLVLIVATCLLLTFLTEVTSNTATATMAMPVLAAAAVQMGFHPFLLMIPAAISASCAFMLPVATPPNAIVFSSGWVTIPQMARAGLFLNFAGVAMTTTIVYLLGIPVFGISGQLPAWVK